MSLHTISRQREILEATGAPHLPTFKKCLSGHGLPTLQACGIDTLQINVGKVCNQTCTHCHVDAGPTRRESMTRETAVQVIELLRRTSIRTLDITGGAPEMNPNFRWLVEQARSLGRRVIDRCNLTILMTGEFKKDLPEFLAEHRVEIVASLPCYLEDNCDAQRGSGVFEKSIAAIKRLNALGYGMPGSELSLSLVYNPVGYSLPPPQQKLEADYREQLSRRYGIEFTQLFTITNLPVSRFLDDLLAAKKYDEYMQKLVDHFNPATVAGVMCRTMISVDWRGYLYDCDFNQMLDIELQHGSPRHLRDFDEAALSGRVIQTGRHCFGCTAGNGSSCGGAVIA